MQSQEIKTALSYERLLSSLYSDLQSFPAKATWLEHLADMFNLDSAVVIIDDPISYEISHVEAVGRARDSLEIPPGKWAHGLWGLDPGRDIPLRRAFVFDEKNLQSSGRLQNFHKHCLEPFHLSSLLCINVDNLDNNRICIRLGRGGERQLFSKYELDLIEGLSSHLQRALSLARFDAVTNERSQAELDSQVLLENLRFSTVVIDENRRVLAINSSGLAVLDAIPYMKVEGSRLLISNVAARKQLNELIQKLAGMQEDQRFHVATLDVAGAPALQVVARPLSYVVSNSGQKTRAVQLYFKTEAARIGEVADMRLLMELFDFSPSEARVAAALASGVTIDDVASMLHRSRNTIRAHARTIYQKANVESQAQLAALVLSSPAGYLGQQ